MPQKKQNFTPILIRIKSKDLKWIRVLAFQKRISVAEMIRRIIDDFSDNR